MADNPYKNLPDYAFWRRSIAAPPAALVDPVVRGKFKFGLNEKVATAGSCFAQHIARYLSQSGYRYLVTEEAHPMFLREANGFNYGIFTARFGNLYTARQLRQLLQRAYGQFTPAEQPWHDSSGALIDPFRPQIQPGGFISEAELNADRAQHLAAVRKMVDEMDIFVFTLGLTEAWISKEDGAVFPLCPGTAGGEFDAAKYVFVNFGVNEVIQDMEASVALMRSVNKTAKMIVTVSPVPLVATLLDRSVLVSTIYSKSVLRVAAEEIDRKHDFVAYFPSYEIITGNYSRGSYFGDDLRSVTDEGVSHVMGLFLKHYTEGSGRAAAPEESSERLSTDRQPANKPMTLMKKITAVICDEEVLDRVG